MLELLTMESNRLSDTGNLEERLPEMCPRCQLAMRQESLRGVFLCLPFVKSSLNGGGDSSPSQKST